MTWKQRLAQVLAQPRLATWAAPIRTWGQRSGGRPRRMSLGEARTILVCRPDEIGDVIMTGPFLRELRRAAPQARITLLVKTACRELVEHCPYVDAVHALDFVPGGDAYRVRLRLAALRMRWKHLRGRGFDLVLLPRRDPDLYDAEMVGHLLAGRGALGVHRETVVKNSPSPPPLPPIAFESFSNAQVEHEVLHHLRFLGWCGAASAGDASLELWLTDADRDFARAWLARHLPRGAPLVVIHPSGGRSRLKQWPIENFRRVLRALAQETPCDFLVIGGSDEAWVVNEFGPAADERTAVAVGAFRLRQLAALLENAALFIGGDSGPMHLASAADIPVIAVFGSTSEARFRPWGARSRVVSLHYACSPDVVGTFENRCQSCPFPEPRCLTELPVESVLSEARSVLAGNRPQCLPASSCRS